MSNIHYSAIKPVHQGPVEFMALVRPPPPIAPHFLPGSIDANWIRAATYRIVLEHLGIHVDCTGTYCDVGELLATYEESIITAKGVARRYKISAETTLTARVLVDLVDTPYVPAEDDDPSLKVRRWRALSEGLYVPNADMGASWLAGDYDHRLEHPLASIKAIEVVSDFEIWSSHSTKDQQGQQGAELRRLAAAAFQAPT